MRVDVLITLVASIIGFYIAAGLVAATYVFGPQLETWISPVLAFDPVTSIYRDKRVSCFNLGITKLHAATPVKFVFFIEPKLSDTIPIAAYLADSHRRAANEDLVTHRVGSHWTRHYCFEIPGTVTDKQTFRVTGHAVHDRHPIYDTTTPIIPFVVPALKKLTDPDE